MADDERQDRAMKIKEKRRKEENLKSSLVSFFFFVFAARFVGLLPM